MPDDGTTGTAGTSAQSDATPTAQNVSDGTPAVSPDAGSSVNNGNPASTPATTRSDDTRGAGYDLTKLLDNLDSLPERVANAVKEAAAPVTATPPAAPAHTPSDSGNAVSGSADTGNGAANPASSRSRSERFAGWWFGK